MDLEPGYRFLSKFCKALFASHILKKKNSIRANQTENRKYSITNQIWGNRTAIEFLFPLDR